MDGAMAESPVPLSYQISAEAFGRPCSLTLYGENEATIVGEVYCLPPELMAMEKQMHQKCVRFVSPIKNEKEVLESDVVTTITELSGSDVKPSCPPGMKCLF
jgi:hypothetical protein